MAQISLKSLLNNQSPSYPEEMVQPFREDLTEAGFRELMTPAAVDAALDRKDDKIVLVMVNSVCGCSARSARPGTLLSLLNSTVPDELVTVFAGMEKDAVSHFREKYLPGVTPSSPNVAVIKNGSLVHLLPRHEIERQTAAQIAGELAEIYDRVCNKVTDKAAQQKLEAWLESRFGFKINPTED